MLTAAQTIPMFPDLAGKVAVVSGSSRGIGAETARYLAANHFRLVINARDREALATVVAEIEASGAEVLGVIADCTKVDQVDDMRHKVEDQFGDIELLLVFAGGDGAPEPIEELSETRWDSVLATNVKSKFLTVKAFLPGMKRRGAGLLMCSSAGRAPLQASLALGGASRRRSVGANPCSTTGTARHPCECDCSLRNPQRADAKIYERRAAG
jgi:3-oxoacyl-[acyl-carrier protein] reductase